MPWSARKCVIVPVDFSKSAADAVREALSMAAAPTCVHVVHVIPELDSVSPQVVFGHVTEDSLIESASRHLATFLASHEFEGVHTVVLTGDPGTKVVEFAAERKADIIVVPSHGYHGLKRLLLGSVAERIVRQAHCPVYVLRRHDAA